MPELPTGTLTLLFTDMEGSTRLLQQLGERYAEVLADCRQVLRSAFAQWQGQEVDTQGDAFFVVFARASDAVGAAVDIQRALGAHSWPLDVAVRVRIGLHTGEPQRTAEGYVGLDVHHAARIMSAGHGGQILLSQATSGLVEQGLPDGVQLHDLGEHRLKDLRRPSRLFQFDVAGLPTTFPPLKTLDSRPHNLPVQPTSLIGREKEVVTIEHLLARKDVRLLTLTGPGGIGKTRLGLQVAAELSEHFVDGVFFVNLAPIGDPAFVIPTIAQMFGLKETGDQPLYDLLKAFLRGRQLLLLLDNFEQVVRAALAVAEILTACPKLKIVVTSRMALHVQAEQEFAVPPLALPDPKHLPDVVELSQNEAVALFISRAQAVKPEFQVSNVNARAIAEICVRLDGLPLAIELAAARSKLLPPQALLARLGQRLAVLTSGTHDLPVRQQTLRNTIAWSYDLLTPDEQRLFRRLAVFVGGCTLEAAEAVCNAHRDLEIDVLDAVALLVDKSLLRQAGENDGEPRLLLLETIREYAWEGLEASGEAEAIQQQHATFFLEMAEEAEPHLRGAEKGKWLARLGQELENLRAALSFLLKQARVQRGTLAGAQQVEQALRLRVSLSWYWAHRGSPREGLLFLEQALRSREGLPRPLQARALDAAAELALVLGDMERSEELSEESMRLYQDLGDRASMATPLSHLGIIARSRSQYAISRPQLEEAAVLFREVGDSWKLGRCLTELARLFASQAEYTRAQARLSESLELYRALGDKERIGWVLYLQARTLFVSQGDPIRVSVLAEQSLALFRELSESFWDGAFPLTLIGLLALQQGEQVRARTLAEESVAMLKEVGDREGLVEALIGLGRIVAIQGDAAAAYALYGESLAILREYPDKEFIAACLEGLGAIAARQGAPLQAAQLWGAAEALREAIAARMYPVDRADYEQAVALARSQVSEKAFVAAWQEGRATPLEQVSTDVLKMEAR